MRKKMLRIKSGKIGLRLLFYCLGLLLMAVGVVFSVNSNLGVSPVNSVPYAASVVSGVSIGTCVIIVFSIFIVVQALLLRRDFKIKNLLQLVFSIFFGYMVDFAKFAMGDFSIPTYAGQLLMLAISIVIVTIGLSFYLGADIIPMPMEGMVLAISKKQKKLPFHIVKILCDCSSVAAAALILLIGTGGVAGLREGTVIAAIAIGRLLPFVKKATYPLTKHLETDRAGKPEKTEADAAACGRIRKA